MSSDNDQVSPKNYLEEAKLLVKSTDSYNQIAFLRGVSHIYYRLSMYLIITAISILIIGTLSFSGVQIVKPIAFWRGFSNSTLTIILIAAVLYLDILHKISTLLNDDAHVLYLRKNTKSQSLVTKKVQKYASIVVLLWIFYIVIIIILFPEIYTLTTEEFPDRLNWIFYSIVHFLFAVMFIGYGLSLQNKTYLSIGIIQFVGQILYFANTEPWAILLFVYSFSFFIGSILLNQQITRLQIKDLEETELEET